MEVITRYYDTFSTELIEAFADSRRGNDFSKKLVKSTNDAMRFWVGAALEEIPMADRSGIKMYFEKTARNSRATRRSNVVRGSKYFGKKTKTSIKRMQIARDLERSVAMAIVVFHMVHGRTGKLSEQTMRVIQRHSMKDFQRGKKKKRTRNGAVHAGLLQVAQGLINASVRSRGYLKSGLRIARRLFKVGNRVADGKNDGPNRFQNPPGGAQRASEIAASLPHAWAEDFAKGILDVAPMAFVRSEHKAVHILVDYIKENIRERCRERGISVT
jgi:hypothetical protein